jgi:hypothetical protein
MKRRGNARPRPPRRVAPSRMPRRVLHTTVSTRPLPKHRKPPLRAGKPVPGPKPPPPPKRQVARIIEADEPSLLDLIDNLLAKGVMLNADLILALANVDLVYVRVSALLCAADRVLAPK